MGRIIFILCLFMMNCGLSYGQRWDSLSQLLQSEKNDSIRFILMLRLSSEAEFSDYEKGREYMADATTLANKLNADWAYARLFLRLSYMETLEGDYAQALKYDLQAKKIFVTLKDSVKLAEAYIGIGLDYRNLGEYDDAYFYFAESYWISKNHRKIPDGKDSVSMSIALHNMGSVFTELGQFDLAYQHLMASERINITNKDIIGTAYTQDEIGELFRKKGEYIKAEENLLQAAATARRLKIRFLLPRVQFHLANMYLDKGDLKLSLANFDSVRMQERSSNNHFSLAECDLGTGMVMAKMGNHSEAMKRYQKSLETSIQLNARNLTISCYSAMASLYEVMNDYQKSLHFHKLHGALRDSIFSKSMMEKLLQGQIRFETMNKDQEIEALSQLQEQHTTEIRKQELIQNILVIVAVLSIILLYTVYRSGQRRKRINRLLLEHQEELKKRGGELEQLNQVKDKFFSIISHDLRSPMSALAGTLDLLDRDHLSAEEFAELTKELRIQFSHTRALINNLLNWTLLQMDKLNILKESVNPHEAVAVSFELLRGLYPKNINFENRVDKSFTGFADPNILNLVLRNLILNAIKFTESGGKVWVEATETDSELIISVCDNGIGVKPEILGLLFTKTSNYSTRGTANEKGTGLGLMLCKEFVERNGGRIWVESEFQKGSTFHFTLPKHKTSINSPSPMELIQG